MKCIKNILLALCVTVFTVNLIAMNLDNIEEKPKVYLFMYENGTKDGIWVDKDIVVNNSKVIKSMLNDLGLDETDDESKKIPLPFPVDIIKLTFNILSNQTKDISKPSLEQIISIANLCNYLDIPSQKLQFLLALLKKNVDISGDYDDLQELHPDLQKLLLVQPTINCLKNLIIKKYLNDRKKPLVGHPIDVHAIAFHPNGKQFVSGSDGLATNNLLLWDISDPNNITSQALEGPQDDIISVAFSPDGTKIASGSNNNQNNLVVWDISDPKKITPHPLMGHPEAVFAVTFSPDSKQLISGGAGNQNNLILWNIDDLANITHNAINECPSTVYSVACNPTNNTQIITGCDGNENNILLWNISDPKNATYQSIQGSTLPVRSITFNSNGNQILFGSEGTSFEPEMHSNLTISNISNLNKITHIPLAGHPNTVRSAHFNSDNTKVASSCLGTQDNLILWNTYDLNNITHQILTGHKESVFAVQFSPDNKYMISGSFGLKDNLILWTFLTDKEEQLLKDFNSYNVDQIRLIYQVCLQEKINFTKDSDEYEVFESLPQDMKNLLNNLFLQKAGVLSSIWQRFTQRNM